MDWVNQIRDRARGGISPLELMRQHGMQSPNRSRRRYGRPGQRYVEPEPEPTVQKNPIERPPIPNPRDIMGQKRHQTQQTTPDMPPEMRPIGDRYVHDTSRGDLPMEHQVQLGLAEPQKINRQIPHNPATRDKGKASAAYTKPVEETEGKLANDLIMNEGADLDVFLQDKAKEAEEKGIDSKWWAIAMAGFAAMAAPAGTSAMQAMGQGGLVGMQEYQRLKAERYAKARDKLQEDMAKMQLFTQMAGTFTSDSTQKIIDNYAKTGKFDVSGAEVRPPTPHHKRTALQELKLNRRYITYFRSTYFNENNEMKAKPPQDELEQYLAAMADMESILDLYQGTDPEMIQMLEWYKRNKVDPDEAGLGDKF